ncbi:MAG: acyl-CoA reductase, partial [Saprospiraceae bacterium]
KLSSKDEVLIKVLINKLTTAYPEFSDRFIFTDRLSNFDGIIATGSNNSSRYFEEYFGKYANIIRKNRNSVAILNGSESKADIIVLGHDIFNYFGLGCRNVSKLYIHKDYDIKIVLEILHDEYKEIIHHNKYKNNFDYNNALFLLNKEPFLMNGCIMVKESDQIASRIACLHYSYYDDEIALIEILNSEKEKIQCIVAKTQFSEIPTVNFGNAQSPAIDDYADNVDTLQFLVSL